MSGKLVGHFMNDEDLQKDYIEFREKLKDLDSHAIYMMMNYISMRQTSDMICILNDIRRDMRAKEEDIRHGRRSGESSSED